MQNGDCMHCHKIILYCSGRPSSLCWTCPPELVVCLLPFFCFTLALSCIHSGLFCKGSSWSELKTETACRRVGLFQGVVGAVLFFVTYAAVPFHLLWSLCWRGKKNNYRSWTGFVRARAIESYFLFTGIVLLCGIPSPPTRRVISLAVYMRRWWMFNDMDFGFSFFILPCRSTFAWMINHYLAFG
jgi:hypothetical protein